MPADPTRRRFLAVAAAGAAVLPLPGLAASVPRAQGPARTIVVNVATYVPDLATVSAARPDHQTYADALRERGQLVMGGPLLDADGRARGVLLVYGVTGMPQAQTLAQQDPFVSKGAIADYRLAELIVRESNVGLLADSLVPTERRTAAGASSATEGPAWRSWVVHAGFASDRARVERVRARHEAYARAIEAGGRLLLDGVFADGSGAMLVYRARNRDEAMGLLQQDPYIVDRVFESPVLGEFRLFGLNAALLPGR